MIVKGVDSTLHQRLNGTTMTMLELDNQGNQYLANSRSWKLRIRAEMGQRTREKDLPVMWGAPSNKLGAGIK